MAVHLMLSAFVITCNRPAILAATLKAARFADELVVVHKVGADYPDGAGDTAEVALTRSDAYHRVPWTPTVEGTRAYAAAACSGDWIISLDDDEILSPGCAEAFAKAIASDHADVFDVPMRHHILGRHDPRCAYWPEYRPCLFRRGMVQFGAMVHRGVMVARQARRAQFDLEGGVFIDHLSHENISVWIEKTNRYTDQDNRTGIHPTGSLARFALGALQTRCAGIPDGDGRSYFEAIAILKAVYDIVDGLKRWEETQPNGSAAFAKICQEVLAR